MVSRTWYFGTVALSNAILTGITATLSILQVISVRLGNLTICANMVRIVIKVFRKK